jgi:peptide/nickel transport system ATP-binding protein
MSSALLAVLELTVQYSNIVPALDRATMTANAGEVVGIIGESGSGKSTLSAAIAGLLPNFAKITAGSIEFRGADLLKLAEAERRRLLGDEIAMVFQDPMTAFNPVLPVGEQLIDFQHRIGGSRHEKRERAAAMLAKVGIPDPHARLRLYPHELSGGMRQRVAIAAALLVNPSLLIADEPTTALDVTMEAQIIHLFRELRRDYGGAIIIVTHHLGVVAELCDRIYVMYKGKIVEEGLCDQIFHSPQHPYTKALLTCDPACIAEISEFLPVIAPEERAKFLVESR